MSQLKNDYDVEKLIMMPELEPRTGGRTPTKIGHMDWVRVYCYHFSGSSNNNDAVAILTEKVENLNQQLTEKDGQLTTCQHTIDNLVSSWSV